MSLSHSGYDPLPVDIKVPSTWIALANEVKRLVADAETRNVGCDLELERVATTLADLIIDQRAR